MSPLPTFDDVLEAARRIESLIKRTPVMTSRLINQAVGAELFFKCEHLQSAGAFKFRGTSYVMTRLTPEQRRAGVITHSSGNHAQALALAAQRAAVAATIVMPEGSNPMKQAATIGYGARVLTCPNTQADRESACQQEMERVGLHLVHPYDDERIIAGAGTATLELLEEVPDLDAVVTPVGGGGLLSGSILAARGKTRVYGAEPTGADDAHRGIAQGRRVTDQHPETVSDGLRTCLGVLNFAIIHPGAAGIGLATDEETLSAMRLVHARTKQLIEPSSAVPLACLLNGSIPARGRIGVVIRGGNVDLESL